MPLSPIDLKCCDLIDPIGVVNSGLRLSWKLKSTGRGEHQSAWEVEAASPNGVILWSSGQVLGSETVDIEWMGRRLASVQEVIWKVRVWTKGSDTASAWSAPARFVTNPVTPQDWGGSWIGRHAMKSSSDTMGMEKAAWIIVPGPRSSETPVKQWFRVWIDENQTKGKLIFSADDECKVYWKGVKIAENKDWRRAAVVDLMVEGDDWLEFEIDSPAGQFGLIAGLLFEGKSVFSSREWDSSKDRQTWTKAEEVGPYGSAPWGPIPLYATDRWEPAAVLAKEFKVNHKVKRAFLFATSLGVMDWNLNGRGPAKDVLMPGWTDFNKRIHTLGWDVTPEVKEGDNSLAITVGDGWYAGYLAFSGRRGYYGLNPQALASLWIQDEAGNWSVVGTDDTWKAGEGPIRDNDLLMGTKLDLTQAYSFTGTAVSTPIDPKGPMILPHPAGPIEVDQKVKAVSVSKDSSGRYIYDFGQNLVGVVELKVKGRAGQKLVLRHAEVLDKDGSIYITNLRAAKQTDEIILPEGACTASPPFTFHGFRYCEIAGLEGELPLDDVTALVYHSPMEKKGSFDSSNLLLNRLAENSDWSLRGNGLDVLTDCPQRDERAGWTGDIGVFVWAGMAHRDMVPILNKYLKDLMADAQFPDGSLADVAPYVRVVGHGNAAWEDAGVILLAALMAEEKAEFLLDEHRAAAVRFGKYLESELKSTGLRKAGSYGDWLRLKGPQHSVLLATLYAAHSFRCLTVIDPAQKNHWNDQADKAEASVCQAFLKSDGRLIEQNQESQSFYAMAHFMKDARLKEAAKQLKRLVDESGGSLATGFMGTGFLLQTLAEQGEWDTFYQILLREEYPGWLYQIKNGATSMWERWDSWTPEKGFQDPGMNSFNHFWIGCVYDPMVRFVAGVSVAAGSAVVSPMPTKRLKHASAVRESRHGWVKAGWKWQGFDLVVEGEVGPNMKAEFKTPKGYKNLDQTLQPGPFRIILHEAG